MTTSSYSDQTTVLAAFDVDGVLADSRAAVHEAYRRAGVDMPDYAWGLPWAAWLVPMLGNVEAARVHTLKTTTYREMIARGDVTELPGAGVVRDLCGEGRPVLLVTSATARAANTLLLCMGIDTRLLAGTALRMEDRQRVLARLSRDYDEMVYFDDSAQNCEDVRSAVPWCAPHVVSATWTAQTYREAISWTR